MKLRRLVSRTLLLVAIRTPKQQPVDPYAKMAEVMFTGRTPGKSTTLAATRAFKKNEALAMGYGGGGR